MRTEHPIPPVWDTQSDILILGSFPSVKSREEAFFYAHPQNRFWRVLCAVFGEQTMPVTLAEKKALLLRNRVALWDVIASCEVTGSSDSSIRAVKTNDLSQILSDAPIRKIYCNGRTAGELYRKFLLPETGIEAVTLPSTSPANAAFSLSRLISEWTQIRCAE